MASPGLAGKRLILPEYELGGWTTTLPAHINAQQLIALCPEHGSKTVMQERIYRAGRLIEHGRQSVLGLGATDRIATVFKRPHPQFAAMA